MPKFSFVIPVYNNKQYLEACVQSVLSQTVQDHEVLLIDDGSTDGSKELCDLLEKRDVRIRSFHKENGGPSSARNMGIDHSAGQYVLFVDGDDTIEPDCLQKIEPFLEGESCLPVFGMCFDYWNGDRLVKTEVCSVSCPGEHTVSEVAAELPKFFNDNVLSSACNKVFPVKLLRDNDLRFPEDMTLYEDLAFVLRCLPHFERIHVVDSGLYHYRNDMSKKHLDRRVADYEAMRKNLVPLNNILHEFGELTGQRRQCATVLANLNIMLLEQHMLSCKSSGQELKDKLAGFVSESRFEEALSCGAELDPGKQKLTDNIKRGRITWIRCEYAVKRWKKKLRTIAKRILHR